MSVLEQQEVEKARGSALEEETTGLLRAGKYDSAAVSVLERHVEAWNFYRFPEKNRVNEFEFVYKSAPKGTLRTK